MDIEVLATSAVKEAIAITDYLSPFVNDKDKEPLWDGHVYAYSQSSKKNQYFIGRAPVQIKGKADNDLAKQQIKYPVSLINLEKYRLDGGTIYFVVLIDESFEKKIYYSALLPYGINKLLECEEKKKKLSITLYEFPKNKNEITNIVLNFVRDKEKQVLLRNRKNISLEDFMKQNNPSKISYGFSYTGLGYDKAKPYEYLFDHDVYMYAKNEEMNMTIPIEHMWRAEIAQVQISGTVCVGKMEYYKVYDVVHKSDCDELHIGKSTVLKLMHEGAFKLHYHLRGNLKERIVAEKFILHLIQEKSVIMNGIKLEFNPTPKEIKAFNIEKIDNHVRHLQDVQDIMDKLGVIVPLECEGLSEKDGEYIRMLLLAFKHGKTIGFNEGKVPPIANIKLNNLCIMLHFKERDDGRYLIENYVNSKMDCSSNYIDGTMFRTSKFTILTHEDFLTVSNLNYKIIAEEIISIENKGHYLRSNQVLLELLLTYDETQNSDLLYCATQIASWLVGKDEDSEIALLNLYQCHRRTRKLEQDEEKALINIIENCKDNEAVVTGAYILLDEFNMARRYFERMQQVEQERFKTFPIYALLQN